MRITPIVGLIAATTATPAYAAVKFASTANSVDRPALQGTLDTLQASDADIADIAMGPTGTWFIVTQAGGIYRSSGIDPAMTTKVAQYLGEGRAIEALVLGPNGSWAVAATGVFYRTNNLPHAATITTQVHAFHDQGRVIDELVITTNGGFVILAQGATYGIGVPSNLWAAVTDSGKSKRRARKIAVGADGRWLVLAEQWLASGGLTTNQRTNVESWQKIGRTIDHVALGNGDDYIFYSEQNTALKPASPMREVEYSLVDTAGVTKNIWQRMSDLGVPGVSVAVIDGNQVKWARGYGELEGNSERFVRATTPYSTASMSKYVTALGAMRMVQKRQLSLEDDARTMALAGFSNMQTWRNAGPGLYGSAMPTGLTVRRLLSHTAGMFTNDTGDGWGGMLDAFEAPTSWILRGYGCENGSCGFGTKIVWTDPTLGAPGAANFGYSNGGFEVVRGMMEDKRNQTFAEIMQQEVFGPLGMTNSTYDILDPTWDARSAPGLNGSDAPLSRQTYQWYAGGGLYASPEDYAKAMMVLMDQAGSVGFLAEVHTDEMLTDQRLTDPQGYGLGVYVTSPATTPTSGRFVHGGYIPNYSWTRMVGEPSLGKGIVIMTNDTSIPARRLVCEIENAFRAEIGVVLTTQGC